MTINLHHSIRTGDLGAITAGINAGANVNERGPDGHTPLMVAAALGQAQCAALLLNAGADALALEPRMGASAIHKAAQAGSREVLELLLDHGAFVDQQSPVLGNTALMDAVLHKHLGAVRSLLLRRARTSIRNHWQQSALDLARQDGLEEIATLIEERDLADARCISDFPLAAAVKGGDLRKVEELIDDGADIEARVPITGSLDDDYTPLGLAVRERHAPIVRTLLAAGADPRRTIGLMRGSPLHDAAYFGLTDHVDLLTASPMQGGTTVEIDAQGPYNGFTPLHDAVWHGHEKTVAALLRAGARVDLKTHTGLTPLDMACLYGYTQVADILRDESA